MAQIDSNGIEFINQLLSTKEFKICWAQSLETIHLTGTTYFLVFCGYENKFYWKEADFTTTSTIDMWPVLSDKVKEIILYHMDLLGQ